MKLLDLNDRRIYSMRDLHRDWKQSRAEDPDNAAPDFKTELLEILLATINGRNDLEIIGMTRWEVSAFIITLRTRIN